MLSDTRLRCLDQTIKVSSLKNKTTFIMIECQDLCHFHQQCQIQNTQSVKPRIWLFEWSVKWVEIFNGFTDDKRMVGVITKIVSGIHHQLSTLEKHPVSDSDNWNLFYNFDIWFSFWHCISRKAFPLSNHASTSNFWTCSYKMWA